jgi:hypothetical protein
MAHGRRRAVARREEAVASALVAAPGVAGFIVAVGRAAERRATAYDNSVPSLRIAMYRE